MQVVANTHSDRAVLLLDLCRRWNSSGLQAGEAAEQVRYHNIPMERFLSKKRQFYLSYWALKAAE